MNQKYFHAYPSNIFLINYNPGYIIYAPLKHAAFAATSDIVNLIKKSLEGDKKSEKLLPVEIQQFLYLPEDKLLKDKGTDIEFKPTNCALFLTSRCNLSCRYCYAKGGELLKDMPVKIGHAAIDFLIKNAIKSKSKSIAITFHGGGEPTLAWDSLVELISYARTRTKSSNLLLHTTLGTNGVLADNEKLDYIVKNINALNISIDGTPEIHDYHRPQQDGSESFALVDNSIKYFSKKNKPFTLRCTITDHSVRMMTEIANFFWQEYKPHSIHFEPMFLCRHGRSDNVGMPKPADFIENFNRCYEELSDTDINIQVSGCDISRLSLSYCGVTSPNFCITPEGYITSCFEALDHTHNLWDLFSYGKYSQVEQKFIFNKNHISKLRSLTVANNDFCKNCFCKFHCGGDCSARRYVEIDKWVDSLNDRCNMIRSIARNAIITMLQGRN